MLQEAGEAGCSPRFPFLAGVLPLGTEQCRPEGWDDAEMKLFFLPFLVSYSQIVCFIVLLKFLMCPPELSLSSFPLGNAV